MKHEIQPYANMHCTLYIFRLSIPNIQFNLVQFFIHQGLRERSGERKGDISSQTVRLQNLQSRIQNNNRIPNTEYRIDRLTDELN